VFHTDPPSFLYAPPEPKSTHDTAPAAAAAPRILVPAPSRAGIRRHSPHERTECRAPANREPALTRGHPAAAGGRARRQTPSAGAESPFAHPVSDGRGDSIHGQENCQERQEEGREEAVSAPTDKRKKRGTPVRPPPHVRTRSPAISYQLSAISYQLSVNHWIARAESLGRNGG